MTLLTQLHKFLVANLKSYVAEYPVDNFEVKINNLGTTTDGTGAKSLPLRSFVIKGKVDPVRDEYSFLYVLGKPDENLVKQKKEKFPSEAEFNTFTQQLGYPCYGTVNFYLILVQCLKDLSREIPIRLARAEEPDDIVECQS